MRLRSYNVSGLLIIDCVVFTERLIGEVLNIIYVLRVCTGSAYICMPK